MVVPKDLMETLLYRLEMFDEGYREWGREKLLKKLSDFMGVTVPKDFDTSYTLTIDNFIKILGIQMRFRCGIPVILMGETGCGKTRLIRFMCDLASMKSRCSLDEAASNMFILKVHGGTTEETIIKTLKSAREYSEINRKKGVDTVLFFDEANTTDAIGLIKEIICDRTVLGVRIPENIKFVAACNPYKRHSEAMIEKLQSAGLGFFVKDMKKQQRIGDIPLWQLVYRVIELPPAMRPLVYDFGQLTDETERDYTKQIVQNYIKRSYRQGEVERVAEILAASQKYMRGREDECSFVSLRDVERAMILFEFFMSKCEILKEKIERKAGEELKISTVTRALILSLCVCYHSRLQSRADYEKTIVKYFRNPLELCGGVKQFRKEILWCEEVILDNMEVPNNIAKNEALRENVFMMTICIENRIPLFIVGKPGSSKSLAKTIVSSSMNGKGSSKELMKHFKEVHMFSYQCSKYSTPESIVDVFNTAKEFQKKETATHVSVVVLDEVGLAEDSPSLPLKALHPLLEDGAEGGEGRDEIVKREQRVAFIGISNWALDPAKMNRGVMVTRTNPGTEELVNTARGICYGSDKDSDTVRLRLENYLEPLAKSYEEICNEYQKKCNIGGSSKKEFYGLRDFYSLIKMLLWLCDKSGEKINSCQLEHVVKRNFGGVEEIDSWKVFKNNLGKLPEPEKMIDEERKCYISPDNSPQGLIRACVSTKSDDTREDRYLLFLTENYTALQTLQHFLFSHDENGTKNKEPFILFGSSFPHDKEYTQTCRNINKIKLCMEDGRMVILLNLENLYESLYDALNQYYLIHAGKKYVDLGLQTHRMKCHVHPDFRLILIAESRTVYDKFPTPLINRLEKHFILSKTLLEDWQLKILHDFKSWISNFATVVQNSDAGNGHADDMNFTPYDAFVGYQEDTPAAIVLQASHIAVDVPHIIDKLDKALLPECGVPGVKIDFYSEITKSLPPNPNDDQKAQLQRGITLAIVKDNVMKWIQDHSFPEAQKSMPLEKLTSSLLKYEELVNEVVDYYYTQMTDICDKLMSIKDDHIAKKPLIEMRSYLVSQWISYVKTAIESVKILYQLIRENKILTECKNLLLKTATPDAVLRVRDSKLNKENGALQEYEELQTNYFIIQCHKTLDVLLRYLLQKKDCSTTPLFLQVTTFGGLLSEEKCKALQESLFSSDLPTTGFSFTNLLLQEFDTEDDFTSKISESIQECGQCNVIVVQCEAGHMNGDLIACARYRISDMLKRNEDDEIAISTASVTHVVFIIQLPRKPENSTFVGFQGDPWVCYHLDELMLSDCNNFPMDSPSDLSISKLFYNGHFKFSIDDNVESREQNTNQCFRLYNCIQAAAAKLSDNDDGSRTIERITILGKLLAKEELMQYPLDENTFCGSVVKYIWKYLLSADHSEEPGEWIFREAKDSRSLLHGGTFRNCLGKRMEEKLIPLLAEIIAFVDTNYNLNLLSPSAESYQCELGSKIFQYPDITHFEFLGEAKQQLPGVGGLKSRLTFKYSLAFSWIIIDVVTNMFHKYTKESGDDGTIHKRMLSEFVKDPIGMIIADIGDDRLVEPYIHDFIRSVYMCTRTKNLTEEEYKLIELALDSMCQRFMHGKEHSLISKFVSVHIVYNKYERHFLWFGETISFSPGILVKLDTSKEEIAMNPEMIHLYALQIALDSMWNDLDEALKPSEKIPSGKKSSPPNAKRDVKTGSKKISSWLHKMQNLQTAVDTCLSLHDHSEDSKDQLDQKLRKKWQQLHVIQILVEQVIIKDENNLLPYARRMLVPLKRIDSDLTTEATFSKVIQLLENMCKFLKKTFGKDNSVLQNLQEGVALFVVEMTTDLCFSTKLPEPMVVSRLIEIAVKYNDSSCVLPMYKVPGFHMFLFHKLLLFDAETTDLLEEFLQRMISSHPDRAEVLSLQYANCCEDAQVKHQQEQIFLDDLQKALEELSKFSMDQKITIRLIKCVAATRKFISFFCSNLDDAVNHHTVDDQEFILSAFSIIQKETSCTIEDIINKPCCLYLVRHIARKYGFELLCSIGKRFKDKVVQSIIPYIEENYQIDPMMVYDKDHTQSIDVAVDKVLYEGESLKFNEQVMNSETLILVLLALYEKSIKLNDSPKAKKMFVEFITKQDIKPNMEYLMKLVIRGELPCKMRVSEEEFEVQIIKKVSLVVIHTIAVFSSLKEGSFFDMFIKLMDSPSTLADIFVPAMPEGNIFDIFSSILECSRCNAVLFNKDRQVTTCSNCGDNLKPLDVYSRIKGYNLLLPERRSDIPSCERSLPASSCQIIRIFLHAILYWTCSTKKEAVLQAMSLLNIDSEGKKGVTSAFWEQLMHDVKLLALAVGYNMDETCLILHMILKKILIEESQKKRAKRFDLSSYESRNDWEIAFHSTYIEALFYKLDSSLQDVVGRSNSLVHDNIYRAVFTVPKTSSELLWRYTPQLTLEQLSQFITYGHAETDQIPSILKIFIELEPILRATQYLPGIVALQRRLYDEFNECKLDGQIQNQTFKSFIEKEGQRRAEYEEFYEALKRAWNLCKDKLAIYAQLNQDADLNVNFDENTFLKYLIPTANKEGRCTVVLVKYLVLVHNAFILKCNQEVTKKEKEMIDRINPTVKRSGMKGSGTNQDTEAKSYLKRRPPRYLQLSRIQNCHLLDYQDDLIPIILLHSQLEGQKSVIGNILALETHIMHKFIHGKPLLIEETPEVVYTNDDSSLIRAKIGSLREKIKQKELPLQTQIDILNQLGTTHLAHQCFKQVCIVVKLASNSGFKPTVLLRKYVQDLDMERESFSSKALECCNLGNLVCLWRIVGNELAQYHARKGEEPFIEVKKVYNANFNPDGDFKKVVAAIDCSRLLSTLYEYIEMMIMSETCAPGASLVDSLSKYIKQKGIHPVERFEEDFPRTILVKQAIGVWKFIATGDDFK